MINDPRAEKTLIIAEQISDALKKHNIPHAIIGAVAMAVHGYARQTADLDFATDVDPFTTLRDFATLLKSTEKWQIEFITPDSEDPLGGVITITGEDFDPIQIVNFLNPVSFSTGAAILVREALEKARPEQEEKFTVIDLPYLIALKLYAGGISSRADVVHLLAANPEFDRTELMTLCDRFGLTEDLKRVLRDFQDEFG